MELYITLQLLLYIITQITKYSFIKETLENPDIYNIIGLSSISIIDMMMDMFSDKIISIRSQQMFTKVCKRILFSKMDFYKNDIGSKISNIMTCLQDLKQISKHLICDIPQSIIYILFYSYYGILYSKNALLLLYITNIIAIICNKTGIIDNTQILKNKILEIMLNIEHVKLHNKEDYEFVGLISLFKEQNKNNDKNILSLLSICINNAAILSIHYLTPPNYSLFMITGGIYFNYCINNLVNNYYFLNKTLKELNLTRKMLYYTRDNNILINKKQLIENYNNDICIEFKNVTFKYDSHNVLDDLSFVFYKNKLNLLLGPNGSGKTTIVNILLRLYENTTLDIKLYGNNIYNIDVKELRKKISFVSYEPYLFDNTIWYNIKYGNHDATDQYITQICKDFDIFQSFFGKDSKILSEKKSILEWIYMNKNIGFRGKYLSTGERKIIQLLNCLCSNADIFIFDEPTNALDNNAIKCFNEFLSILKIKYSKTIVIITHDLRMIKMADHIVEL